MFRRHSLIIRTFVQMTSIMLLIQVSAFAFDIPAHSAPKCSLNIPSSVSDSLSESHIVEVSDGVSERCAALLIPDREEGDDENLPVLFDFHGSGGSASKYGSRSDQEGNNWAQIAVASQFAVVGGEALQFGRSSLLLLDTGDEECFDCFTDAGCEPDSSSCESCLHQNRRNCSRACRPLPLKTTKKQFCGQDDEEDEEEQGDQGRSNRGQDNQGRGKRGKGDEGQDGDEQGDQEKGNRGQGDQGRDKRGKGDKGQNDEEQGDQGRGKYGQGNQRSGGSSGGKSRSWRGGKWLIPQVQNDETGIVCDWENNRDLRYINALVSYLEAYTDSNGNKIFDTGRIFFTGCSMGGAMTIWVSQCMHQAYPERVSAFGTQSTGLKVKGDGLTFPTDNYDPQYKWGECPECKYFPAPVVPTQGLKACIDQGSMDTKAFCSSSEALEAAWDDAGMDVEAMYHGGGHCNTKSFNWIAECMDDETGRLFNWNGKEEDLLFLEEDEEACVEVEDEFGESFLETSPNDPIGAIVKDFPVPISNPAFEVSFIGENCEQGCEEVVDVWISQTESTREKFWGSMTFEELESLYEWGHGEDENDWNVLIEESDITSIRIQLSNSVLDSNEPLRINLGKITYCSNTNDASEGASSVLLQHDGALPPHKDL